MTPLPTIRPADVPEFVQNLFETNGGCQLPCWWGIVPGQTTWANAWNFLSTFATINDGPSGLGQLRSGYRIAIPYPSEGGLGHSADAQFEHIYIVRHGIVRVIRVGFEAERYPLPEVLATFGQPEQVWIRTVQTTYSYYPFYVVLLYPDQGIMVLYPVSGSWSEDSLRGCPQYVEEEPFTPELLLWDTTEGDTFLDLVTFLGFPREEAQQFRSLEEATGLDVETFYEVFKDPGNTECLTTPIDLWP